MRFATSSKPYTKEEERRTEELTRRARENERRSDQENERLRRLAEERSRK